MIDRQLIMNFSADNAEGYEKVCHPITRHLRLARLPGIREFLKLILKMLDFLKGEMQSAQK